MHFFFSLLILLQPCLGLAQIVTSSYDRTVLSINPASSTTRHYSQAALFGTVRTSESDIPEIRSDGSTVDWKEKINMNKVGVYFTGHGKFTPELYLSKDSATKSFKMDQGASEDMDSNIDLINNMINLGFRLKRHFSVGLKFYNPKYSYKEEYSVEYEDATNLNFKNDAKSSIRGIGAGFTFEYQERWHLGGYYISVKEETKFSQTFTDIDGSSTTTNDTQTRDSKVYGVGISFLEGTKGHGWRTELALSRMVHPEEVDVEDGEEIFFAMEFAHRKLTFGGNLKLRKHLFYENVELLDYIVGDKTASSKYTPYYGGFVSFGFSHGHSIGLSGVIYNSESEKNLFGQEQKAQTSVKQVTFNYAYLF